VCTERQDVVPLIQALSDRALRSLRVPLPAPQAAYGFPYNLVEVLLTRDKHVALVYIQDQSSTSSSSSSAAPGYYSLPLSHVDKGENLGFTASRTLYGITKVVAKPDKVIHIAYQTSAARSEGM
jgi:hypothetical protein